MADPLTGGIELGGISELEASVSGCDAGDPGVLNRLEDVTDVDDMILEGTLDDTVSTGTEEFRVVESMLDKAGVLMG